MVRLTRAQQQARTRAAVLAAAREEFVEYGYASAKVDRIAERAELTRGAVYSNFPGKRALYLAVLADLVEKAAPAASRWAPGVPDAPPADAAEALGAFARAWLERLPLVDDTAAGGRLHLRSLVGVVDDEPGRTVLAQVARLEALLLGLGLEACGPPGGESAGPPARRVRLAELALTLLGGAGFLAETAPGFGDPFDRARACAHLAGLDLADTWAPSHLPYVTPAAPCRDPWSPPEGAVDHLTGDPVDLGADGLVAVLGARRLGAAEEAVRAARRGDQATVVVVTGDPAETGALVRLRVADLAACLRRVFPPRTWRPLRLVVDDTAGVAAALGLPGADDDTEAAVRVHAGVLAARAQGRGAAYAAATAATDHSPR
ncbi:TetR/AcrR family transcriptional regulator [Streptomonospora nanhaiensis]|uniref:TetR/AcrR family transcriptional regulator n=1 Tax=Streptomonospora nanhaiensis TaxID=1323731 RepID=UPI001C99F4AE|nr:helix-turn-helix domain-containing protein [Streptomonospora nanhaiensis]MBX9391454.1 TetR/AcrR family transcriptional regulator [Streptomonospora nanhaiensis]